MQVYNYLKLRDSQGRPLCIIFLLYFLIIPIFKLYNLISIKKVQVYFRDDIFIN